MKHGRLLLFSLSLVSLAFPGLSARATTYTVKAGGGGNYSTISACAAVATAGDTCLIYAGSYSGWAQNANGVSGSPIVFTANTGDTVTVTSGITISGRGYVTFSGLHFSSGGFSGTNDFNHITISSCTFTGTSFSNQSTTGNSDNVFSGNTITVPTGNHTITVFIYGDRNRFENNEYSGSGDDFFNLGGANVVVRGNYAHGLDAQGNVTNNHIDFVQAQPQAPNLTYSLIEHNVEIGCLNDGGNCHALILRGDSGTPITGVIYRFNYAQNIDGAGVVNGGGSSDIAQHTAIYNNTIALEKSYSEIGALASCWQGVPTYVILANNISYNSSAGGYSPSGCGSADTTLYENGNIAYTTGYSGTWNSPYSGEATYNTLRNLNPLFVNYPTDAHLQSGSPAINAGANLSSVVTTVANSTTLTVTNGHAFQPGWGGANGDCIRVGSSTTTCISAISYSGTNNTNGILTVSPAVSATSGDAVNLYSDSSGTVVLNNAKPDIGAYPYGTQTGGNVLPPTNLQASVQ